MIRFQNPGNSTLSSSIELSPKDCLEKSQISCKSLPQMPTGALTSLEVDLVRFHSAPSLKVTKNEIIPSIGLPNKINSYRDRLVCLTYQIAKSVSNLLTWCRENPRTTAGLVLGTAAMFTVVFWVAPLLTAGFSSLLAPSLGLTVAAIVGTAIGGGLASGTRSLLVHITPMLTGVDPFNRKQLLIDVGMSATFGFFGFAQAAALTSVVTALGVSGFPLFLVTATGLIGYEVLKDFLQNTIRNQWANDPKSFKDIWLQSLSMETMTNVHRCIPGLDLATNFGAKVVADLLGTVWWDRIVNTRNESK